MTNLQRNRNASAIVKTLVRNLPAAGCFIFIQKKLRAYPGTLRGTQEWDAHTKSV